MREIASYEPIHLEQPVTKGPVTPPGSWRDALLALLPYLWPLFFLVLPAVGNLFFSLFRWTFLVGIVVLLVGLFVWLIKIADPETFPSSPVPLWAASWFGFPLAAAFITIYIIVNFFLAGLLPPPQWGLSPQPPQPPGGEAIARVVILACLFGLLRWNQRLGLLAALPYLSLYLGWWWRFDAPQAIHEIAWLGPLLLLGTWLWLGGTAVAIVRLQKSEWAAWLLVALCLVQVAIQQMADGVLQPYHLLTAASWPHYLSMLAPFVLILLLRPFWAFSQQGSTMTRAGYYLLWAGLLLKMLVFTDLIYLAAGSAVVEPALSLTMRVGLIFDLAGLLVIGLTVWSRGGLAIKIAYPFLALALILAPLPYTLRPMVALADFLSTLSAPLLHGLGLAWLLLALIVSQVGWTSTGRSTPGEY
jgi:hypothetical protein